MKRPSATPPESGPPESEATPDHERRFMRGVVHDHKGTAHLQWYDAQQDYERQLLELEDKTRSTQAGSPKSDPASRKLDTGGLSVKEEDSFDPYTRRPETERKRGGGTRTDLRRLSAWIKMMRELEQARKRDEDEDSEG